MKHLLFGILFLLLFASAGRAAWLREVKISHEPEKNGQVDYTVKLTPDTTHRCDQIIFECVYHQEFPWEDVRGRKYTKVHEPVSFTYRRHNVKLVADLDAFISFRVPVSMERLVAIYGQKVFRKGCPIAISRIKISGLVKGKTCWSHDLKSDRTHKLLKSEKPE